MSLVLNDLYDYGLKIYQDSAKFKFSLDSILLSEFVEIPKSAKNLLDLCSGNAPLPLIISTRSNLNITGIELQPQIYDLALKSIQYNHLENRIKMLQINAKDTNNYFPGNNFDIITCNPPFFKYTNTSLINTDYEKALARHEITITLKDIFKVSSSLLKDNGAFYLVHRPERLQEIISYAIENNLSLQKLTFIYSNPEKCAIMVLFKFLKHSNPETKVTSLTITRDTKTYKNIFKTYRKEQRIK